MLILAGEKYNEVHSSSKLANELSISESYLQQLSKYLCAYGLMKSYRGPRGGYALTTSARNIRVGDVIRAMKNHDSEYQKANSKEEELWNMLFKGLIKHLDTLTIKSLAQKNNQIPEHELTQNNLHSSLLQLII